MHTREALSHWVISWMILLKIINIFLTLCVGVSSACISLYQLHARCLERPEEVIWSLELKLYIAVSIHIDAGNWTLVLWKNSQCFELLSHLSNYSLSAYYFFFSAGDQPRTYVSTQSLSYIASNSFCVHVFNKFIASTNFKRYVLVFYGNSKVLLVTFLSLIYLEIILYVVWGRNQ